MIEELINMLCLDLKLVLLGIAVTIGFPNAMKKFTKVKGSANLIFVGISALVLGFLFGLPDAMSVFAYVIIIFLGAVFGWETAKTIMHKAAEPKNTGG